ncbi:D-inositol-3-phosphate glycosyltransferase [subsurface metagenome]
MIYYFFRLFWILVLFNPKIVYFTISPIKAFFRDLLYVFILKLFNKKIIYHLHVQGIKNYVNNSRYKLFLYKWAYKNAHIICLSHLISDDISEIYRGKPFIVNNGIKPIISKIRITKNSNKIRILFLSNLLESKGVFDFVESIKILKTKYSNFIAVMVGNPSEISEIELNNYIRINHLANEIEYLGPKYNEKKFHQFLKADLFVYPTKDDAFPLTILEAMNFGLPIITTKEGGIPDIIDDNLNGMLVEKGKPIDLANKLVSLFEDESLRKSLGMAAKEKFFLKYTEEIFNRNMKEIFLQIQNINVQAQNH